MSSQSACVIVFIDVGTKEIQDSLLSLIGVFVFFGMIEEGQDVAH
jgi:hypothetical protein